MVDILCSCVQFYILYCVFQCLHEKCKLYVSVHFCMNGRYPRTYQMKNRVRVSLSEKNTMSSYFIRNCPLCVLEDRYVSFFFLWNFLKQSSCCFNFGLLVTRRIKGWPETLLLWCGESEILRSWLATKQTSVWKLKTHWMNKIVELKIYQTMCLCSEGIQVLECLSSK